ncbi:MAG: hypothetical protein JSS44_01660 [Proteobacteria bacterium]|nr:hypothetical protein [Pseudomonadota bacterium]MBS0462971.1 hypothetical protein [Pseudomonadota bacterium]MBS0463907.1 hypothetical protein [Pseudomonadota bacterium]
MKSFLLLVALAMPLAAHAVTPDKPSRAASRDCKWERIQDEKMGLALWAEQCDYHFRKVDHFIKGNALMERFSDGGDPSLVIETFDLRKGESIEAGIKRVFDQLTPDKTLVKRCELKPYHGYREVVPPGVKRYTFVPNAAYQKVVDKKNAANDGVPDPACGDWGDAPDGIQYFEAQPGNNAHRVMFVSVGQDVGLFDENTLRLLPPAQKAR